MAIYILGGWQSDFAKRWSGANPYFDLLAAATEGALQVAQVNAGHIGVIHVGNLAGELFCGQAHLGGIMASVDPDFAGLPTARHEAACASGSVAVLAAMSDLEAGRYDVALVIGAEVLRNVPGAQAGQLLACAAWVGHEAVGEEFPWPHLFGKVADAYLERWGLHHSHLSRIAEINMHNAKRNPNAQTRDWNLPVESFAEDDDRNPPVAGMLRKQDCGRITDGCAAIVLASERFAQQHGRRTSRQLNSIPSIQGWGHTTSPILLENKLAASVSDGGYLFPYLRAAIRGAMDRAAVEDVYGLDAIEVHDCFTISEYVVLDHFAFAPPGRCWEAIEDGVIADTGKVPVNPSGGLLGLGHPVGATGIRMLLDAAKQVANEAGDYQVPGAQRVATLNLGGAFTTAVSFVVGRG